jgi:UDP-4-amino-4,6-dideoxy-N-acetyl-beta-L-altrosamine N-acetyltransferase
MIAYEGSKTRLRPLRRSDSVKSLAWRNDPEIRENAMGYRFPVTQEMEDQWFESALNDQSRTRVVFAIEAFEDDSFIGIIQLNRIDWIARSAYFGITIGEKKFQGRGMAVDSMRTLFAYAFGCLNLRKICLEVVAFNARAIKLYREFGFVEEGVMKEQVYLEGRYHDLVLMRMFDTEFRAKHPCH